MDNDSPWLLIAYDVLAQLKIHPVFPGRIDHLLITAICSFTLYFINMNIHISHVAIYVR